MSLDRGARTASSSRVYMIWWVMIGLSCAGSFVAPLSMIPGIIFWTKILIGSLGYVDLLFGLKRYKSVVISINYVFRGGL